MKWLERYWWVPAVFALVALSFALIAQGAPPDSPKGNYVDTLAGLPKANDLCFLDVDAENWHLINQRYEFSRVVHSMDGKHVFAMIPRGITQEMGEFMVDSLGFNYGAFMTREDGIKFFREDPTLSGLQVGDRFVPIDSVMMEGWKP